MTSWTDCPRSGTTSLQQPARAAWSNVAGSPERPLGQVAMGGGFYLNCTRNGVTDRGHIASPRPLISLFFAARTSRCPLRCQLAIVCGVRNGVSFGAIFSTEIARSLSLSRALRLAICKTRRLVVGLRMRAPASARNRNPPCSRRGVFVSSRPPLLDEGRELSPAAWSATAAHYGNHVPTIGAL